LHFSLGDDFRASKVTNPTYEKIEQLYITQREHLHSLCKNVPFYFVLGNHELEAKAYDNGTPNCIAAWSLDARRKMIPNPDTGTSYINKTNTLTIAKENRQNYYAFEWGDVLFVVLDVFRYSNISAEDEEMKKMTR